MPGIPVQNSPLFRTFEPTSDSVRIFPQLFRIISNFPSKFELLPSYSRDMTFRVTVRDNARPAGGAVWKDLSFTATEQAGPFNVTIFNTIDTVRHGEFVEITWDVANTDQAPVNCETVNILLSTNGGLDFDYVLAEGIPNNGSFFVTMPAETTTSGRVMIEAADNIFFDINNANLRILPPLQPGFSLAVTPYNQIACTPNQGLLQFSTESLLGFAEEVTFEIVSGLPPGATVEFDANPVTPPAVVTATIDLSGVTQTGTYELLVKATANGAEDAFRTAFLHVFSSDYSSLNAVDPAPDANGIGVSPLLTWVQQPDAQTYTVELSTSPAFGNTNIVEVSGVTGNTYQVTATLDESTLYFWRVIPENVCGSMPDPPVFAFHTVTLSCSEFTDNTEYTIPGGGTPTIESVINVPSGGTVSEVRVRNITGNHQNIGNLRGNLRGPDNTQIRLFNPACFFINGPIDMGFNDDSQIPVACPPDDGDLYKSFEPLATFQDKDGSGDWTLVIEDVVSGGAGTLTGWTLELCSNVALNAPFLVNNNLLALKPGTFKTIDNTLLLTDDADNSAAELTYTLVEAPMRGQLLLAGAPIQAGAQFSQEAINLLSLTYEHGTIFEETDLFTFTVEDGQGGWVGIETFQIETDNSVSTDNPTAAQLGMTLWPNPANAEVLVRIPGLNLSPNQVQIFTSLGQPVTIPARAAGQDAIQLDASSLATGLYFVQVTVGSQRAVSKLQIQK